MSNNIILHGMGESQQLITSGYGLSVETKPTSKIYIVSRLQGEVMSFEKWKQLTNDGKILDAP